MNKKLKIGYEFNEESSTLDPARIEDIFQSNLIENLFSRIVEFDNDNNLSCVLCEKFWIEDDKLYIQFKDSMKSSRGEVLDASDAHESFKRLMLLNKNTHGNLALFLKTHDERSLKVEKNTLIFEMVSSHYSQFLLPLLASMDFSIIPKNSIGFFNKNGRLDLGNTSGFYFLDKDLGNGHLILKSNSLHAQYDDEMFGAIEVVPTEYGTGIENFLNDEIDVLDVTYYPGLPQYEKLFSQKNKKFNYHKTHLINVFLLNFSSLSANDLSSYQRFYISRIISEKVLGFKKYGYGFENVIEFFQSNGAGHLDPEQNNEIQRLRLAQLRPEFKRPVVFGVHQESFERMKEAFKNVPEIQIKSFLRNPGSYPLGERPDVFLQTTDSSFNEDITLMSYNFSMEYFGYNKQWGENWISSFIAIEDKQERIKKLQSFQLELLKNVTIFPMGASPYWAIARDDLDLNFSEHFPGSTWWKIRTK